MPGEVVVQVDPLTAEDARRCSSTVPRTESQASFPCPTRRRRHCHPVLEARPVATGNRAGGGAGQRDVTGGDLREPRRAAARAGRWPATGAGSSPHGAGRRSSGATDCSIPTSSGGSVASARSSAASMPPPPKRSPTSASTCWHGWSNKSLVTVVEPSARGTRYRLLETVREFAVELLVEAGEAGDTLARHLHHFSSINEPTPGWPSRVADRVVASLEEDYGNVRAALEWAATNDPCGGLRLLAGAQAARVGALQLSVLLCSHRAISWSIDRGQRNGPDLRKRGRRRQR